ncbi:MAG: hypothetical protein RSD29_02860 [Bacilli bacterium]
MYEEGNRKINSNWISLAIKLALLALFVFILVWIFSKNGNNTKPNVIAENSSSYVNNIGVMKTAALEYFTDSKLPTKVGETEKLTLSQMVNQKLLIDFTDDGKSCDLTNSYVQATKTADENYALKVSLNCDKKSDFIVTTIAKKCAIPGNTCKEEAKGDTIADKTPSPKPGSSSGSSSSSSSSNNGYKPGPSGGSSSSNVSTTVKTTIKITVTCPSCNTVVPIPDPVPVPKPDPKPDVKPDPKPEPKPDKVLYYKYVKYSPWYDGYRTGSQYENNCSTKTYYDYCKENTNTYYTTYYVPETTKLNTTKSYTLRLDNISNRQVNENTVGVSNKSYFGTDYTDYRNYINTRDENISMVGANNKYNVYINSPGEFRNSALKRNNFTFNVSGAYKSGNAYYVDITFNYKNNYNVSPYYASNLGYNVYFVPIKFNVNYSNYSDCTKDSSDNSWKYPNHSISNSTTENKCQYREITYVWSKETSLAGYTYTGISEYR